MAYRYVLELVSGQEVPAARRYLEPGEHVIGSGDGVDMVLPVRGASAPLFARWQSSDAGQAAGHARAAGQVEAAAGLLGISRTRLYRKLRELDIVRE